MNENISVPQRGALKIKPAAEYCSLSVMTLRRLIQQGVLKANRKTRHVLIPVSELDKFLKV